MMIMTGKRYSIHHHLLKTNSKTANVLELRQTLLYTTTLWVVVVVYKIALPNETRKSTQVRQHHARGPRGEPRLPRGLRAHVARGRPGPPHTPNLPTTIIPTKIR